jgi:hypothetical protein
MIGRDVREPPGDDLVSHRPESLLAYRRLGEAEPGEFACTIVGRVL